MNFTNTTKGGMFFLIVLLFGCAKQEKSFENKVEYINGSKLLSHYNAERNKTSYSLGYFKFTPTINGISESGHSFEFGLDAEAGGKFTQPDKVNFELLHDFPKKSMWHYPKNTNLIIKADGKSILEVKCKSDFDISSKKNEPCLQNGIQQDSPKEDFYDALFFDLLFSDLQQMGNAQVVSIGIDKVSFDFTNEAKSALKRYNEIIMTAKQ